MCTTKSPKPKTVTPETEPFAKCQRCHNREADLTTTAGEKVCANCATPDEVANGNAA
jgi:hypothetical protein